MMADQTLFIETLLLLVFGHFLADFPLQGEFLSKLKNLRIFPDIWWLGMTAHCTIHAGIIFVLTGNIFLACVMFLSHFGIDYLKCVGDLGEGNQALKNDQLLHFLVLIAIAIIYCYL